MSTAGEERVRVLVLKPESSCETWVLGASADVNALGGVELMPVDEHHSKTRQGLAAPAHGRPCRVRAVLDLDVDSRRRAHPCEASLHVGIGRQLLGDFGVPGDPQQQPASVSILLQDLEPAGEDILIIS
jgi:hypothetical protein